MPVGPARASGVDVTGAMTGNIANSGSISAVARAGSYAANVAGLRVGGGLTGSMTNNGSIRAEAVASSSDAFAYAVYFENEEAASHLTNTGSMVVQAQAHEEARAAAVYAEDGLKGDFQNRGSISIQVNLSDSLANAYGLYAGGDRKFDGTIGNEGSVSVSATARKQAKAYGYNVDDQLNGNFSNSGTITAHAGLVDATNSASADAAGVYVGDMRGNFSNSGVIRATAAGGGNADAYGLHFENFDGVITAVGDISATSESGDAYAIYLGTGTGTLNLISKDKVGGLIRVQNHDVNLNAIGGSAVFRFEDAATGSGAYTTTVSDGRSGWFVQGEGGAAPVYASVDSTELLSSADVAAFYGSVVNGSLGTLNYGGGGSGHTKLSNRACFECKFRSLQTLCDCRCC